MQVEVSISRETHTRHRPAYAAWAHGSSSGQDFTVLRTACWSLARVRGGDPLAASKIRAKSPGRNRFIGVWSRSEAGMLGMLRFDNGSRPETASHDLVEAGADLQPNGFKDSTGLPGPTQYLNVHPCAYNT